ncbi:GNAT family N-acetyltransferase [Herbiconiux liangxiaofengii]|uniref:GNAT family N-acetyltransferase n=1 Tax=Herbiconiux liangxiaofengii TaxID=3342795 RepID=UPI0035B6BCE6
MPRLPALPVSVERVAFDHPEADALRRAQRVELDARYGSDDHEPGEVPTAASTPVFVLARTVEGRAVGCGGLRPLEGGGAEVKRMYVHPEARGRGVSTAVLRALEDEARLLGVRRLVLETGTEQPDAMRFYEREGYERIEAFGPYVGSAQSVCYARTL